MSDFQRQIGDENMKRFKNNSQITTEDLMKINDCLVKFDKYLRDVARKPTDENIGLYEHWVDCMYDIENLIVTER